MAEYHSISDLVKLSIDNNLAGCSYGTGTGQNDVRT